MDPSKRPARNPGWCTPYALELLQTGLHPTPRFHRPWQDDVADTRLPVIREAATTPWWLHSLLRRVGVATTLLVGGHGRQPTHGAVSTLR